jgi:hypothetical protein
LSKITEAKFGREIFDLLNSDLGSRGVELNALFLQSLKLHEAYNTILPKVTPRLIDDLFARLQENPHIKQPIYMIEIFTKKINRTDKGIIAVEHDKFRECLISISGGSVPAIYDHNSHYVLNIKLTFENLKALNDIDFVLQICGDYTGTVTSVGAAREYRPEELEHVFEVQKQSKSPSEKEIEIEHTDVDNNRQHKLNTNIASKYDNQLSIPFKHRKNYLISDSLKMTLCILVATAGVASLVNLGVNGDIINPNTGIFFPTPSSILKETSDYGMINGEVTSPSAAAATSNDGGLVTVYKISGLVDSLEKSAGYTENSAISHDGHFMFKLPSGVYRINVIYPDGKGQLIENYAVWPGSHTTLNLISGQ